MDIHARDHADAFDHGFGDAAVLRSHPFDRARVVLVEHRVLKEDVAMPSRHDLPTDACPNQSWSDPLAMSVAIDRVMPALLAGISKVRQRVVDLADQ